MTGVIERQVSRAREFLARLDFDRARSNERSALVLLALLGLRPGDDWRAATNPSLRTVEIMRWIRDHYDHNYRPNTRETIRRQTLHQFVETLLVEQNRDDPERPVNSPKWCYRLHPNALYLAQRIDGPDVEVEIVTYLSEMPGLRAQYAKARELHRIPVTLPDGSAVGLSPGGQNVLIKAMVEGFCADFTPGAEVLYVGDADAKWAVFQRLHLADLGVTVDQHGKMPDLVVYLREKNWLVLMEAASSHGPVDSKRHAELASLFSGSSAWSTSLVSPPGRRCGSTWRRSRGRRRCGALTIRPI